MHWIIIGIGVAVLATAAITVYLLGGVAISLVRDFFDALMNMR